MPTRMNCLTSLRRKKCRYYTRGITTKRATSGVVHLCRLAPGTVPKKRCSDGDLVSDVTGPRPPALTAMSLTTTPIGQFYFLSTETRDHKLEFIRLLQYIEAKHAVESKCSITSTSILHSIYGSLTLAAFSLHRGSEHTLLTASWPLSEALPQNRQTPVDASRCLCPKTT